VFDEEKTLADSRELVQKGKGCFSSCISGRGIKLKGEGGFDEASILSRKKKGGKCLKGERRELTAGVEIDVSRSFMRCSRRT